MNATAVQCRPLDIALLLKGLNHSRGRVSLQRLENFVLRGRTLESAILYGSEPPAVETYWRHAEKKGWKVNPFRRSVHSKKEKEVDCAISVDITKTG